MVQPFIWCTRLISSVLLLVKKVDQHSLTYYCGSGHHMGHKISFFLLYSLSFTYKTANTDAYKTCCITPIYATVFLQMNPRARNMYKTSKFKN
jgi:hypothetical protein